MTTTIEMTTEELDLVRSLVGHEIDSINVVHLPQVETMTPYVQALARIEGKLAVAD